MSRYLSTSSSFSIKLLTSTSTLTSTSHHSCPSNCTCRTISAITTASPTSPKAPLTIEDMSLASPTDLSTPDPNNAISDNTKDATTIDFDFEDLFTYDNPQKKLASVMEVSTRQRRDG